MPLSTKRLGCTDTAPLCLEVVTQIAPASCLLWHLSRLPGLQVIAKKSWALTDDFEAYFLYKGRLYVMQTPMVNVWISLIGQPPNEEDFREIEEQVQRFSAPHYLFAPLSILRYFFSPFKPPRHLLQQHEQAEAANLS